jgi:uncharacterized protein (TIGR02266 family)
MTEGREKRSQKRCTLLSEIQYQSNSPALSARVSDISAGGLFIDTVNALQIGAEVTFTLKILCGESEETVTGEGVVTWRQETVGMGLRFTRMSRGDWEKIKRYVADSTD